MPDNRQTQLQLNFNGGQVSTSFTPRVDMAKYLTATSLMRNLIPSQYGKLSRRPGFKLVNTYAKPFRIFYFPCTSEEVYLVCVFAEVDLDDANDPFCIIYQCGYLNDPTKVWTCRLQLKGQPAKNGWSRSFSPSELNEVKHVSQNDKLWLVEKNHFPIVLTRTRDKQGNIEFELRNFNFLVYPSSDDYFDSFFNLSGVRTSDIGLIPRAQGLYPGIQFDAPVTGTASNDMFADIAFLYDPYQSDPNYTTSMAEWIGSNWAQGDVIITNVKLRTTDGYYNGSPYRFSATSVPYEMGCINMIFRYVKGSWKIDTNGDFDNTFGFYTSSIDNQVVHQGYPTGITVSQIFNTGQTGTRRVTISGNSAHGEFLGFAFTNQAGIVRTGEGDRNRNIEFTSEESPYIDDVPFAVYTGQQNLLKSANNGVIFRNLNALPMAYSPDRAAIYNTFENIYILQNYYLYTKEVAGFGRIYNYRFNNFVKCAFCVQKGYPSCVTIRRGRLIFAGTNAQTQTIWASRVDRYDDFTVDENPDSGWNLTIGANQSQQIKWLSSSKDLIVGTDIGEWVINDDDSTQPVPTIREQSRWGSSFLQGELLTESIFWVPKDNRGLIHSIYSFQIDGYQSQDVSIVASDLVESGIASQAIMKDPDPIWWGTTGDGRLVGFLFNRVQEIQGWHQHDIPYMNFQQVETYSNPVKGAEGLAVILKNQPSANNSHAEKNRYVLAFMELDHPCIDFFQEGIASVSEYASTAGFLGGWNSFGSRLIDEASTPPTPIDNILASNYFTNSSPRILTPDPSRKIKIDIITTADPYGDDRGKITGYCWTYNNHIPSDNTYYFNTDGVLTGGRIKVEPLFETRNNAALANYVGEGTTMSHYYWGLHVESEFVSMPMGNTSNYIIPATSTKINQLRYQVLRDSSNDIPPDPVVFSPEWIKYGKPRIQANVEASDYSSIIGINNNDTLGINVYLNNGRGHEVLSGPSSTDTRLTFKFTDGKKTDILAAYIIYDTNLL